MEFKTYVFYFLSAILVFADPAGALPAALDAGNLRKDLERAGHRIRSVSTRQELTSALGTGSYDLVMTDYKSAASIEADAKAAASHPTVLPTLYRPSAADLAAAKRQYHCVMKAPSQQNDYLAVVNEALAERAEEHPRRVRGRIQLRGGNDIVRERRATHGACRWVHRRGPRIENQLPPADRVYCLREVARPLQQHIQKIRRQRCGMANDVGTEGFHGPDVFERRQSNIGQSHTVPARDSRRHVHDTPARLRHQIEHGQQLKFRQRSKRHAAFANRIRIFFENRVEQSRGFENFALPCQ